VSVPSPTERDAHFEIELLLPWYVTGRLDSAERETVDLHLADCDACRALLAEELALRDAVVAIPCPQPPTSERAPVANAQLGPRSRARGASGWARMRRALARPRKPGWFIAAQAATIAIAIGVVLWNAPRPQPATYRTLSAAPSAANTAAAGNIAVMFDPAATEADLRNTLQRVNAKIVDGPTAAGAYLLRVDAKDRDAAIVRLRGESAIDLAEAIDADDAR